jgi:hypothetical protein
MNSNDNTTALHLDYRNEFSPNLAPAFRAVSILAILIGALGAVTTGIEFFPYLSGQSHFPAYYPAPSIEFVLNLVPFSINIFALVAGSIALSSGGSLRPLVVWAWCHMIGAICANAFNLAFGLLHAKEFYKGYSGSNLVAHFVIVIYYLILSMTIPILLIVLRRLSYPGESTAVLPKR